MTASGGRQTSWQAKGCTCAGQQKIPARYTCNGSAPFDRMQHINTAYTNREEQSLLLLFFSKAQCASQVGGVVTAACRENSCCTWIEGEQRYSQVEERRLMLAASHALSPEDWSEQSMDCSTHAQTIAYVHTYHADHRHKYRRVASAFVLDAAQKVGDGGHNKERKSRCQPEIFWRTNELLVMIRPYAASLLELQMILWRRINHHPWPPSLVAPSRPQMHSSSAGVF